MGAAATVKAARLHGTRKVRFPMPPQDTIIPEEWRPIPGYETIYEASNLGRVRRTAGGRGARAGRVLKQSLNHKGYPQLVLQRAGRQTHAKVHRLVGAAFLGPCPPGQEVNHKNGIKTDNHRANLEWATPSQNTAHAYRIGLIRPHAARGESHGNAKLTDAQVREIRQMEARASQMDLARRYKVSQRTICAILRREAWCHV